MTVSGRALADPPAGASPGAPRPVADRYAVRLELTGFSARVVSACAEVADGIAALYPTAAVEAPGAPASIAPPFAVVHGGPDSDGPGYRLTVHDDDVGLFETPSDVVAHLEYLLNAAAATGLGHRLLFHAGVVARGRSALAIPGRSGAGKSTLVTALCLAGFRYLSDELAVVDPGTGAAWPFLKPICLKDGGWRILAARFGLPSALHAIRADGVPVHYLRPPRPAASGRSVPIRVVVLPRREAGAEATLMPASRVQALAELAQHSLNLPRHGRAGLELLARLVERAACYTLRYDDLSEAVAALADLTGGRPSGG